MAGMSMGDYGKDAPTGGGIRLRILRDAIVERKKIEVVSGGIVLHRLKDEDADGDREGSYQAIQPTTVAEGGDH